jgi:hypothetical protein
MRAPYVTLLLCLATMGCRSSQARQEIPDGAIVCSQDDGPIEAGAASSAGPYEVCTPEYPTCTPPYPESPGYQCCADVHFEGGGGSATCMP